MLLRPVIIAHRANNFNKFYSHLLQILYVFDIISLLSNSRRAYVLGCAPVLKILSEKPGGGLSDKCLLMLNPVFHMPGPDHRRLWINRLPGQGLFLFLFHKSAPSGGIPPKTGCAVFNGLCNGRGSVKHCGNNGRIRKTQKSFPWGKLARPWARLMREMRYGVKHCGNNRRKGVAHVGVVLRAANQNLLIAGGNHTFIHRLLAARDVAIITCVDERIHLPAKP